MRIDRLLLTCAHWHQDMDAHQRFVAAADMLFVMRRDEDPEIPSDSLIRNFERNIDIACEDAGEELGMGITTVAAMLYSMEPGFQP